MIGKPPRSCCRMNDPSKTGAVFGCGLFLFQRRFVLTELICNFFDQAHFQIYIKGQFAYKGKKTQILLFSFPGGTVLKGVHSTGKFGGNICL